MKVALGTIEIDDETRKAIRKARGEKGHATRGEVKEYLLGKIDEQVIPAIGQESSGGQDLSQDVPSGPRGEDDENSGADLPLTTYQPSGQAGEGLPEPTEAGDTAGGGTTPTTGNLGSDGTPGGTV